MRFEDSESEFEDDSEIIAWRTNEAVIPSDLSDCFVFCVSLDHPQYILRKNLFRVFQCSTVSDFYLEVTSSF